jgi:hypothetical protein
VQQHRAHDARDGGHQQRAADEAAQAGARHADRARRYYAEVVRVLWCWGRILSLVLALFGARLLLLLLLLLSALRLRRWGRLLSLWRLTYGRYR